MKDKFSGKRTIVDVVFTTTVVLLLVLALWWMSAVYELLPQELLSVTLIDGIVSFLFNWFIIATVVYALSYAVAYIVSLIVGDRLVHEERKDLYSGFVAIATIITSIVSILF